MIRALLIAIMWLLYRAEPMTTVEVDDRGLVPVVTQNTVYPSIEADGYDLSVDLSLCLFTIGAGQKQYDLAYSTTMLDYGSSIVLTRYVTITYTEGKIVYSYILTISQEYQVEDYTPPMEGGTDALRIESTVPKS